MATVRKSSGKSGRRRPPARSLENRENQLIELAYDLVEERIRNKTATAAELCHFLKMGTAKTQLEKKKLEAETMLLESKKEAVDFSKRNDAMYEEVISAFRSYQGIEEDDE